MPGIERTNGRDQEGQRMSSPEPYLPCRTARLRLEPDDEQSSRPVLRGLSFGNETWLPDAAAGASTAGMRRSRVRW